MRIHTVGGYDEVGKNMNVLEFGENAIIIDDGIFLPAVIGVEEREKEPTEKGMRSLGALPDDEYLERKNLKNKVRAILISHAHLDHVGAVQYNAHRYKAPILTTPYTAEVLKILASDNKIRIKNQLISVTPNSSYTIKLKKPVKVEFLNMTHSTLQCSLIVVHTPEGILVYSNDYKLDNAPTYGEKPNYKRMKELAKIGVKVLIADCLYAPDDRKTPSEKIAKGLLEDVFFSTDNRNAGMIVTTFSSHIARLKTIVELGKKLNREVIFLGRSLNKYTKAAKNINKAPFMKDVKIYTYRRELEKIMKKINKNKKQYLVVCTGHQGEPGSMLDRISRGQLPLKLSKDDHIIFSSKTIPTPANEESKGQLIRRLKKHNVRIFDNVHVSGHGGREDLRDLINLLKPKHIIPSHGDLKKTTAGAYLAVEMGYKLNKTVHLMQNSQCLTIN